MGSAHRATSDADSGWQESHASEAEARFRLLVQSVHDYAIFMLDSSGRVSTWNAGAQRIKGYSEAEIIGRHFSLFYPPHVAATGKCDHVLDVAAREGRFEEEGWRLRKDGSRFWASVTITALRSPEGVLVGFAKVTRDLTARREAEEESRRFRLLIETVEDYAIFIIDPSGYVSTWNPGAERIKGYTAAEIVGKHFSVFYPPEVDASAKCARELEIASEDGRFEEEGWRVRKDGSRFWASVTITALRDPEGALIGFAKVTRDLTARRAAEESKRALAVREAALAERIRIQEFQERFLGILGHDLRNPLAAIQMGTGILQQQYAKDPAAVRVLDRLGSSALRMSRMIEQILDLTRSRLASGLEVHPGPVDLCDTLTAIVDELRTAHPSSIIELRCPSLRGEADRDRLEQVFSNLIGNAVSYGEPTRPVVVEAQLDGSRARIEVHNDGPPIPADLQGQLFDPFRRGERDSRTSKTGGLGLGLFISRELVLAHGGSLEFQSDSTHGTTFRVTLPGFGTSRPPAKGGPQPSE
jgi:PAS domain S-box-containing protein